MQSTGDTKQGLVPLTHLGDEKMDIPQKSHLYVERANDAKQNHETTHKSRLSVERIR